MSVEPHLLEELDENVTNLMAFFAFTNISATNAVRAMATVMMTLALDSGDTEEDNAANRHKMRKLLLTMARSLRDIEQAKAQELLH